MLVSAARITRKSFVVAVIVATGLGLAGLSAPHAQAGPTAQLADPIPDPIPNPTPSGLGLTLTEFATFPKSNPTPPPTDSRLKRQARINFLSEIPDGSQRLVVPDLNGKLYLATGGTPRSYLDVGATFAPDFISGRGLGSGAGFVAFHPQFGTNGKFYTAHTEWRDALRKKTDLPSQPNPVVHGVLTEWTAANPAANTFRGTRRELLRLGFRTFLHSYQQIGFNPTAKPGDADYGLLYLAAADGGVRLTTRDAQDLRMPHGKILRIDPLGSNSGNGKYGIPASNPFVGRPNALGEIYAYGLRNPHRFSWDALAPHRMLMGNIGEANIESIYEVKSGDNFGWPDREGPFVIQKGDSSCRVYPLPVDDAKFGYTYPVAAYDHDKRPGQGGCGDTGHAVIGGFVYRGSGVPGLRGKYVFGDDVSGRLFYTNAEEMRRGAKLAKVYELRVFNAAGRQTTMKSLAGSNRVDLRFGADGAGELYVLAKANGKIWKVTGLRQPAAACNLGDTTVTDVMGNENWRPVTPANWEFPGDSVVLAKPGVARPGPRRPFEYAALTAGPNFGSVQIKAEVRIDRPVSLKARDVIVVFGYRSDTEFYYAHLSTDNTIYPHNGIFVVSNADRLRIDHQWDGSKGAAPAITDADWHQVRVVRCAQSGEIAVYVDGSATPLMTATDTTFRSGRVGFGSFDDFGRLRNLTVTGTAAAR